MPDSLSPGQTLFRLYTASVGGTTHDGQKLTWDMLGDRQRHGWEAAARLFSQGLMNRELGIGLLPDPQLQSRMATMLSNQLNLNVSTYASNWLIKGKSRDWIYPVAASQEISEFINSAWLPWWSKENTLDASNQRIELVDALHFMMSELLICFDGDVDAAAISMAASYENALADILMDGDGDGVLPVRDPIHWARQLQSVLSLFEAGDDPDTLGFYQFFRLCHSIGFTLDQLQALYIGKSVLNTFRRDNGYKAGTYVKLWDGKREDNYFLAQWIAEQPGCPSREEVRAFLESNYAAIAKPV